jgi:methyl-accepting chemotaxis protein
VKKTKEIFTRIINQNVDRISNSFLYKVFSNINSLKKKLLIFNTINILLVILISTIYMLNLSTDNAKNEIENNLKNQSIASQIILEKHIEEMIQINTSIVTNDSLKTLIEFDMKEQLVGVFKDYQDKFKKIDGIIVLKEENVIYKSNENYDDFLKENIDLKKENQGLIDINGLNIFSLNQINDSEGNYLVSVVVFNNVTKDYSLLKNISTTLDTNSLIISNEKILAMSTIEGKIEKTNETLSLDYSNLKDDGSLDSNTHKILDNTYFIYNRPLKDYNEKSIGVISVAISNSKLTGLINKIFISMVLIGLILLGIGIILTWIMALLITRPISLLLSGMKKVQNGDLTVETYCNGKDEIKELSLGFNKMVDDLKNVILMIVKKTNLMDDINREINEIFKNLIVSMKNITNMMVDIDNTTTDNSAVIEEVNAGMQLVSAESYDIVNITDDNSKKSNETIERSTSTKNKLIESKNKSESILKDYEELTNIMLQMEKITKKSDKVVKLITTVANNTRMVSLNASIEAARAGDLGKGFAVVADEVINLSLMIKEQADIITGFNKELNGEVNNLKEKMDENSVGISSSLSTINSLEKEFKKLFVFIDGIDDSMKEVVESAKSQAASSKEISTSLDQISSNFIDTATSVSSVTDVINDEYGIIEKSFDKLEVLNGEFKELLTLVTNFKI